MVSSEGAATNSFAGPDCEVWDFPQLDESSSGFPSVRAPDRPNRWYFLRLFVGTGTADDNSGVTGLRTKLVGTLTPV